VRYCRPSKRRSPLREVRVSIGGIGPCKRSPPTTRSRHRGRRSGPPSAESKHGPRRRSTAELSRLTSSVRRLSINLVRRTKRSACSSWTPLATWQSARRWTRSKACAWLAWIRPNAYDVERRLGVERLPGELPGGATLGQLPAGAGEEASDSQRGGTLRRLGIATVRHPGRAGRPQAGARVELEADIKPCSHGFKAGVPVLVFDAGSTEESAAAFPHLQH
jgi:hypothetical protein